MGTDEGLYHATPQTQGKIAHINTDDKRSSNANEITALPVCSVELGIVGIIDLYKKKEQLLVERKYQLKNIFKGHYYQLWGQYFCMIEMGFPISNIAFYEISTNKMISIALPSDSEKNELFTFIQRFKVYNPEEPFVPNLNKCKHCIYCNLCDKTDVENVY